MNLIDSIIVIEKQFSYLKNVLAARKEHFHISFENSLFEGEQSPAEVFIHGITPLYRYCRKIINSKIDESTLNIELNIELDYPDRYLDLYEKILHLLREIQEKNIEEDLNQLVETFDSKTLMTLREWLNLNIMHTVTHVGQALRLQSLYIRHNLKIK
ncbi:MAG: hypothetical protein ACXAC8_18250 [Candidatus Hodarchaeales archaeon]|jgi:hypothetical protein